MSLHIKKEGNGRFLEIYWGEEPLRRVDKALFVKELASFFSYVSRESFEEQFGKVEEKVAKQEIVRMLSRKGYFSDELRRKLSAKGFSCGVIERAIDFGKKGGMIDDDQELDRVIRSEQRKGRGPQAIVFKLKQKKVDSAQLQTLKHKLEEQEKQSLLQWICKRYAKGIGKDPKVKQKIVAQLYRRGFSLDAIFSALDCLG